MNKIIKSFLLIFTLLLISNTKAATVFDVLQDKHNVFSFNGTAYVDTGDGDIGSVQKGIGIITAISDLDGNIIWTTGELNSYIYYIFDGYTINTLTQIDASHKYFSDTGGLVDFYYNTTNIFSPTGNFATDSNKIISKSELFLKTSAGIVDENGNTLIGTKSSSGTKAFSVTGGILNVIGGSKKSLFDTNSINSQFGNSDLTFDISGNNINTSGYTSRGSVSGTGKNIPEPITLSLLGFGLLIIGLFKK